MVHEKYEKRFLSHLVQSGVTCASKLARQAWPMLPPRMRSRILNQIVFPAFKQLFGTLSIETRETILRGEIVLSKEILGLDGWHDVEFGPEGAFRWSGSASKIRIDPRLKAGFLQLDARYPEQYGKRRMIFEGDSSVVMDVHGGRRLLSVPIRDILTESNVIAVRVEPAIRPTTDSRELGIMVSAIRVLPAHSALAERGSETDSVAGNLALNEAEWASGETCLASCPPRLRIDLEARCNIKPPCAYCDFDYVKGREALSDHAFRPGTLIEMGSFFRRAEAVLDCSIGEPLISRHFEPLAILMGAFGKRFDFTTNGQLLNERLQEVVLGRNMIVCVSLEAVTAELYSLYRNNRFDVVIDNLSKLCRRKREHGNLPTVIVAYLAMQSNVGTFEKFVDLMKELGVDAIKIRNLNPSTSTEGKEIVRNGRRFVYGDEVLSLPELKAFVDTARAYTQEKGMQFYAEIDFGEFRTQPSQVPICDEPWKTLYFFKRGIFPCCFGHQSLFRADDRGNLSLEEFLWQVWNSKPLQEIRFHLAQGRPAPYCMNSTACPVVQKRLR